MDKDGAVSGTECC